MSYEYMTGMGATFRSVSPSTIGQLSNQQSSLPLTQEAGFTVQSPGTVQAPVTDSSEWEVVEQTPTKQFVPTIMDEAPVPAPSKTFIPRITPPESEPSKTFTPTVMAPAPSKPFTPTVMMPDMQTEPSLTTPLAAPSVIDPVRRVQEIVAAQAASAAQLAVQDVSSAQPRAVTAPIAAPLISAEEAIAAQKPIIGTLLPSVRVPSVTAEPVSTLQRRELDRIRLQAAAQTAPVLQTGPAPLPVRPEAPPIVVSPGDEQPVVAPIPRAAPPEEDVVVVAPDGSEMLLEHFEPAPAPSVTDDYEGGVKEYFGFTPMQLAIGGLVGAGAIYMLFFRK
jgi:hypothetical protein